MMLQAISKLKGYQVSTIGSKPLVLYDEHRWVLPVIREAQNEKLIPTPCTIVTFDRHHDALPPRKGLGEIPRLRKEGQTIEDIFQLVESHLSATNDDWLRAGMELGFIGDAILFGPIPDITRVERIFKDSVGQQHQLFFPGLPGRALSYQGDLSDLARSQELQPLWNAFGWTRTKGLQKGFGFAQGLDAIVLDFDLDCFVVDWREYLFPWPSEVFEKEFLEASSHSLTTGLKGQDIVKGIIQKAGIITLAREPIHCGGTDKSNLILESLDKYFFDGHLEPLYKKV
jgi:hypothetical protein